MTERTYSLNVNNEEGRIDKVLTERFSSFTRTQIQSLLKEKQVTVNGQIVKANYKVQAGDQIVMTVQEEEIVSIQGEAMPLHIVYEDDQLAVIYKESGMVVHPSKGHLSGTLVNGLLHHFKNLSDGTGEFRPGIVHRIDKDTSGLLVIAKTNEAHEHLAQQFLNHTTERVYTALVHGEVEHDEGRIDAPIGRMTNNRMKRTVTLEGRPAVTHFKRLELYHDFSLLELKLETGRTHQIRVHMTYINHPVVGDPMYGPAASVDKHGQYLHAGVLGFEHPTSGEWLRFEQPLPDYFVKKIEMLAETN